jgi:hypothetical protein
MASCTVLDHKLHQLGSTLSCRPEIDVDPVHALFFLPFRLFGNRAGILFLESLPDDPVDHVEVLSNQ